MWYAPTEKVGCRECGGKIAKEEVRIKNIFDKDNFVGKYYYHVDCYHVHEEFAVFYLYNDN